MLYSRQQRNLVVNKVGASSVRLGYRLDPLESAHNRVFPLLPTMYYMLYGNCVFVAALWLFWFALQQFVGVVVNRA